MLLLPGRNGKFKPWEINLMKMDVETMRWAMSKFNPRHTYTNNDLVKLSNEIVDYLKRRTPEKIGNEKWNHIQRLLTVVHKEMMVRGCGRQEIRKKHT